MSDHQDQHHHDQFEPESSTIKAKPVLAFLGILAVATAFVFVLIFGLIRFLDQRREADQTPPPSRVGLPEGQKKLPPEPRLQGAPAPDGPSLLPLDEMRDYQKKVDALAAGYSWVDKSAGVARIPIDRAKELVAQQGLPMLSETAMKDIERAEATRRMVLGADSSAGRSIRAIAEVAPAAAAPTSTPAPAAAPKAAAAPASQATAPAAAAKPVKQN